MGGPGENGQTPPDDEDQGTVYVQGSRDVTVTVESYSTDVDTSGADAADLRSGKRGLLCDEVQQPFSFYYLRCNTPGV